MVTATLPPGSTFAGYRIEEIVGRGGMGVVYRAYDPGLERPVALKLIAPELAGDPRFRERFLRETRLAASLEHPHILPVHAAGDEDGVLYLVARFVEGEDLGARLRREGRFEPEEALRVVGEVAEALDAAHARGLVHRDVKPGNVLLDSSGEAYLGDFGLTKRVGSGSGLTRTGEFVGTIDYLAPEQIRSQPLDGRVDQYALACLLFECLAGEPPFVREQEAQALWAHMNDAPPSLAARAGLPEAIDGVLARGLAKEPGERFGSCSELVAAAGSALGVGVEFRRAPLRPAWVRSHARLLLAVGALVVAGAVAAAAVQLTRDSGPTGIASVAANSVAAIDPETNEIVAQIPVGRNPTSIAFGEGAVWVLNADDRTISRIDPETKEVREFGTGTVPIDIAAGEGAVWVLNAADRVAGLEAPRTVTRIDPDSEATLTIELPPGIYGEGLRVPGARQLAVGDGAVFAIGTDGLVARIDPRTNEVVASIDPGVAAGSMALADGALWIAEGAGTSLVQVDLGTGEVVETLEVGTILVSGIAVGGGVVWATDAIGGTVWRLEPGGISRTIEVGEGATAIAFGEGSAWVVSTREAVITRIDPGIASAAETISVRQHAPGRCGWGGRCMGRRRGWR